MLLDIDDDKTNMCVMMYKQCGNKCQFFFGQDNHTHHHHHHHQYYGQWPTTFKNDNDYNPGFDIISKKIQQLQTTHTNHSIDLQDQLILQLLLPNNTASFYRYHGSVTTPPCTSNVTWLIMDDPNEIEFNQVSIIIVWMNEFYFISFHPILHLII